MNDKPLITQLMDAFRCLPGVGPKTAQRMVMHLLERDREGGARLARVLEESLSKVGQCQQCRNLTELATCEICANPARDHTLVCIVESPADVLAIEGAGVYRGDYFVLMGHLSPIDGIGPADLGLDSLQRRVEAEATAEIILATNPTVEGEATAHYISDMLKPTGVQISRLAHGIPIGGELEYVDASTLSHALEGRRSI